MSHRGCPFPPLLHLLVGKGILFGVILVQHDGNLVVVAVPLADDKLFRIGIRADARILPFDSVELDAIRCDGY